MKLQQGIIQDLTNEIERLEKILKNLNLTIFIDVFDFKHFEKFKLYQDLIGLPDFVGNGFKMFSTLKLTKLGDGFIYICSDS